jgi:hypothetical protein
MRALAASLALLLAVPAHAGDATARTWLSGLGLGLITAGAGAVGLGVAGLVTANDASGRLFIYSILPMRDPRDADLTLPELIARRDDGTALALAGFIGGGLLVAGGLVALLLDRPMSVAVAPTRDGAFVSLAVRL